LSWFIDSEFVDGVIKDEFFEVVLLFHSDELGGLCLYLILGPLKVFNVIDGAEDGIVSEVHFELELREEFEFGSPLQYVCGVNIFQQEGSNNNTHEHGKEYPDCDSNRAYMRDHFYGFVIVFFDEDIVAESDTDALGVGIRLKEQVEVFL